MRRLLSLTLALSLPVAAQVQEQITVERILVDARVTDYHGDVILGLKPADFTVKVDGKAASVESVEWIPETAAQRELAGLDDAIVDRAPSPGEWSVRETVAHAIEVERSSRAPTEYAPARAPSDPVRMPDHRRPTADPADTAGATSAIVARFAVRRAETDAAFAWLDDQALLARPTVWTGVEVDVRHRLHRFGSHIVEHTYQCEKAIRARDAYGGDARTICRKIGATRGLHERGSDVRLLDSLDTALAEKARIARP